MHYLQCSFSQNRLHRCPDTSLTDSCAPFGPSFLLRPVIHCKRTMGKEEFSPLSLHIKKIKWVDLLFSTTQEVVYSSSVASAGRRGGWAGTASEGKGPVSAKTEQLCCRPRSLLV